jgi:hypothetical protein
MARFGNPRICFVLLLVIFFASIAAQIFLPDDPDAASAVSQPDGVLAPNAPVQTSSDAASFHLKDALLTPLANFDITARVLARKTYQDGKTGDLMPVDFALGWGKMSDSAVLKNFHFKLADRFFHWTIDSASIPREEIETHSANLHLIPASSAILDQIQQVRVGNIVHIKGWLVKAERKDGWSIMSSLTRNDTGDGACEVVYVKEIDVK